MTAAPLVVDLFDRRQLADPASLHRRLLDVERPVRTADGHALLCRYDEVRRALADHAHFSSVETNGAARRRLPVLVGTDPPDHTRLRRLSSSFFAAGPRRRWHARVERRIEAVVHAAVARRRVEAVSSLCAPVARAALAVIMGIDEAELAWLLEESPSRYRTGRRRSFADFFARHLAARAAAPADDLLSVLCAARAGEDRLRTEEMVAFCILLTAAGTDSIRDLLANLLVEAGTDHRLWDEAAGASDLLDAVTDEGVRHVSPVQGVFRTTVGDGAGWRSGDRVVLLLGAANRDGSKWTDPDLLLPHRYAADPPATAHLGFGGGVHSCLGLALARVEVRAVLRALLDRGTRPVVEGEVVRARTPYFRTVRRLPLRFDAM